ncbi:pyridoxamine 5'-phosphate oxidase family protein [Gloeobacter kilaueensis]|uniref:Pyridoxamine 5'-phosphate oxidase n=1 Tax=Gloeobacter kilaueensis (strain ATCC BAA-2537 / CCAP 1431/1 / ULC 316 / JS1) TaxID=1183438 RepID=U5QGX1_GLOK1|nr:pyridoxamine 5'-phosphate oxidase family protein [Gloeobacter kilaueensis]AGY58227.1 pyridoxamine 5'-phosphate oxidase [Gloeobacter kilaueensis JS1]
MATFFDELGAELQRFIARQPVFFTATAPEEGRINLSPKGIDTFRCIDARTVGYLDLTGSGNETAAHLHQNGRMTVMFCSFTRQPLILRLYGRGEVIRPDAPGWQDFAPHFQLLPGTRQIIVLHIESVQTSCGFGVPVFGKAQERLTLIEWSTRKGEAGLRAYRHSKNRTSIDGLPTGIESGS